VSPEPRIEELVEARWHVLRLSREEQSQLEQAGRLLAVGRSRESLIHCRRLDARRVKVRVMDAVGMVATSTLQLNVAGKIPTRHLLHLMEEGGFMPRGHPEVGGLETGENLTRLVARWFVDALQKVVDQGLARDYVAHRDVLGSVRGRIVPLSTARLIYSGRLAVDAEFDELDVDTPLNRLLREAALRIAAETTLPRELCQDADRAARLMLGVGRYVPADAAAVVDRRTGYYEPAVQLARQVLVSCGRTLQTGGAWARGFLIRTATPVEDGLRALLQRELAPMPVAKRAKELPGAGSLEINPDLVFGDAEAIADVKYKVSAPSWKRSDLYEVVAFATGFGARRAAIIDFRSPGAARLDDVTFGDVEIRHIGWPLDVDLAPQDSARVVVDQVRAWLASP
jgi:5-methylcytosine-specific restriction enzyme subunit McrC